MDKRTSARKDFQQDATIIINNTSINCNIQNISCAGALIRVDTNQLNDSSSIEIGIDIEIAFKTNVPAIKGKILRLAHDENFIFFAVCFLERYQFE